MTTPDEPYDIHDHTEDTINDAYLREAARLVSRGAAILLTAIVAMLAQTVLYIVGVAHLEQPWLAAATIAAMPFTFRVVHRLLAVRRNRPGRTFTEALREEAKSTPPNRGLLGWVLMLPLTIVACYGAVVLWDPAIGLAVGGALILTDLAYRRWSSRGGRQIEALARMQQGGDKQTWEA